MPSIQRGGGLIDKIKGALGKTEWNPPIIQNDETLNEMEKQMIYTGREMVNAMELGSSEWLSKQGHFFPKEAFYQQGVHQFLKSKSGDIQIKPGTKRYYEAVSRGTLGRIRRTPKLKPVHELNRIEQADRLQALRDQDYTLDLSEYQKLLADPKTNATAVEELRTIKALIEDAAKSDLETLEKKLEKTKLASSGIGLIGTALGAASGLSSLGAIAEKASNVAQGATQQAFKLTESIVDKIGKANAVMATVGVLAGMEGVKTQQQLNQNKLKKLNINTKRVAIKTAYAVAMKTSALILLGVAANLTPVGGTITALAIVTTAVKGGLNVYAKHIEKKGMAIQMNKQELLNTIDEMIQNNGTIFYKTDNVMFAKAFVLKDKVDEIVNTKEEYKVFNEVAMLENSITAAALLNDMMKNAVNASQNAPFEEELRKLKEMEGANNLSLQKLRNRRGKLKHLYNTYKKPMIEKNIQNVLNEKRMAQAASPPNQVGGKTRKRRN
jgi:hypothetical protein